MKKASIYIKLSTREKKRWQEYAKQNEWTLSELVRGAVNNHIGYVEIEKESKQ